MGVDLSGWLVGPTTEGNDDLKKKSKAAYSLLDSFKNSNDWVAPAYSSLVRTIILEKGLH